MAQKTTKFHAVMHGAQQVKTRISLMLKPQYQRLSRFVKIRPLTSFFAALGLLFIVLIIGNVLQHKPAEKKVEQVVKPVSVFSVGDTPKATFQAKIEKAGVITLVSQTGGVIQGVFVTEGQQVSSGQQLFSLSSTYQGGNAPSVQRQIAQAQYQNVLDTFDQQKETIQKQRDIANKTDENADKLREISRDSLDETNALIDANQSVIDSLKQNSSSTSSDEHINQVQAGLNQLRQAARSIDYSSSDDNAPAKLSDLQKDLTLKQLGIQEKGLDLQKEVSRLQLQLATIGEQTMSPASPFAGTVERVHVSIGQSVAPGTVLATIAAKDIATTAVLAVPGDVSKIILTGEPSELIVGGKPVAITARHVATQATTGQLYEVVYDVPVQYQSMLTAGEYVSIDVPIAPADMVASLDPFIPVDSVYQSQENAFVLVVKNGKAEMKEVQLGNVYGSYVEALHGISSGDHVILDRNVVAGEKVKIN